MKKLQSFGKIAALSVATLFTLTSPARAILINTFEFTNEDGSGGLGGDTVSGTITFNSLNSGFTGSGVSADSIVIDSVSSPYFDGNEIEPGINILGLSGIVSLDQSFNIQNGIIQVSGTDVEFFVSGNGSEFFCLNSDASESACSNTLLQEGGPSNRLADSDSSSLIFSEASASVPFEFSPGLGLLLIGGAFGVSRYAKSRKASKLMDNE